MIKVVRGNPTPEELAAAVTVVQARAAALAGAGPENGPGSPGGGPDAADAWADPARVAGPRLPAPGPRVWERTYRPNRRL
jgi:hypothetical protein